MDFKQEDDFWNATSGNSFVFDDENEEEIVLDEEEKDAVFHSTLEVSNALPLRTIISPKNLELILQDVELPNTSAEKVPIEETVRKLCLGIDCSLEEYKSESDKLLLLDKTVETYDGNAILKVILYLVKTLKQNILYRHLSKRLVALSQYCNYLANSNRLHDLELLYMATGNKNELSNLFYLSTQNTSVNYKHKKLTQFNIEHLDFLGDEFEKSIFQEHKKFLDYKINHKLSEELPTTVFANLCLKNLNNLSINNPELQTFIKLTKMSSFKSEWIMLNVISANEKWQMLSEIFPREKWFNIKGVTKKYNIRIELIVYNLHKHGAPRSILEDFLKNMDDTDKALYLGQKYKCYSFVIDTLSAKKDRLGLVEYKSRLMGEADWIRVIDKALLTDKKWIN